jgi:hypothetical protein
MASPFINVAEHDGTKLKTEAAIRKVPVHSELISCGLLEYVGARSHPRTTTALPWAQAGRI